MAMYIKVLVQCLAHGKSSINIEHQLAYTGTNEAKGKKIKAAGSRKRRKCVQHDFC